MSASDKKRLRKEQAADFLTEKQLQEQAEAKKLKVYTITFVAAMLLVVVTALGVLSVRAVNNSGVIQKNTVAATVGEHKLNSVELSYYYVDAVNEYHNNIHTQFTDYADTYLETIGLDTSKPLDEQIQDEETGKKWSEYFLEAAIENAKLDYAMYDKAQADGFKLPEDEQSHLDTLEQNIETYASLYGYAGSNQYLRAMYGYGADAKSYVAYNERTAVANAYISAHHDELKYEDDAIRQYETGKEMNYDSFSYDVCYMSYTEFRQGGTEDEEGNKTYSEEENQAAREALKAAADDLVTSKNLEELKAKADAAKVNDSSKLAVNTYTKQLYSSINGPLANWLADAARKEGDIAAIPNESTTKNDDGTETTVINGYYVAIFNSKTDNKEKMADVRHLLVQFEGGTTDEETQETVYSAEEKAAAKTEAEGYFKTWSEGEKTEDSFIALVKEHSDDSSAAEGGLFTNINRASEYVPNFLNWSINADRKAGDCEVIETEYGYHVMYYVGDSELNYRDYMISEEMRSADHETWYNGIVDAVTATVNDTSKMNLGIKLG